MHLDRGYDFPKIRRELNAAGLDDLVIQTRRQPGDADKPMPMPMRLGLGWIVEAKLDIKYDRKQTIETGSRVSEPKKWMSLAAIGAAIAALVARLRHRSDRPSPPAQQVRGPSGPVGNTAALTSCHTVGMINEPLEQS